MFVALRCGEQLLLTREASGEVGMPGGKREGAERGEIDTLRREFREEVGQPLPQLRDFAFLEWGTPRHAIRLYSGRLPRGADPAEYARAGDPGAGESVRETWWAPASALPALRLRAHIRTGLRLLAALDAHEEAAPSPARSRESGEPEAEAGEPAGSSELELEAGGPGESEDAAAP